MRERIVLGRDAVALLAILAIGWLAGLVVQWLEAELTGYGDLFPPQLLLGALLCVGAGAAVRLVVPGGGTMRRGAVGGIAMAASIVVAYLVLMRIALGPSSPEESGETWFSLLIEAPFWIGVPLMVSSASGALGWWIADRRASGAKPAAPTR